MWLSEQVLYFLAKLLYRTEAAHTTEMKQALASPAQHSRYRRGQLETILASAKKYGVDITDKVVLDLGCNDGSITVGYPEHGARRVVGVDIDADAIRRAQERHGTANVSFLLGQTTSIPVPDASFDVVISYDVFEHVSRPDVILRECFRLLKPGGKILIATWGWHHPFAPHLWATMPVPWAHVFFSERTVLRTCRRVYRSPWYLPNMHDLDENGLRKDKYLEEEISTDYLNKFLISDFEKVCQRSGFHYQLFPQPFGSKWARWTKVFLRVPWVREFVTSYIWIVLEKPADLPAGEGGGGVADRLLRGKRGRRTNVRAAVGTHGQG
jgi:ubiquinone/menaquinone biosynthesis C-methylase UbiE